jgi:hypothetical protein
MNEVVESQDEPPRQGGEDGILDFAEPTEASSETGPPNAEEYLGLEPISPTEGSGDSPLADDPDDDDFEFVGRGEMDETEKENPALQQNLPFGQIRPPYGVLQQEEESTSILDSVVSQGSAPS